MNSVCSDAELPLTSTAVVARYVFDARMRSACSVTVGAVPVRGEVSPSRHFDAPAVDVDLTAHSAATTTGHRCVGESAPQFTQRRPKCAMTSRPTRRSGRGFLVAFSFGALVPRIT